MKKIIIKDIIQPDSSSDRSTSKKYYRLSCPKLSHYFKIKGKVNTRKFAAGLAKFLTKLIYELNYLNSEIHNDYRRLWPYMDNSEEINRNFLLYDKAIERSIDIFQLGFKYMQIFNAIDNLNIIIDKLLKVARANNHFNEVYHLNNRLKALLNIKYSLLNYGEKSGYLAKREPNRLD